MKKQLDYLGVSAFAESMGMMIQAGIGIDEAISLLKPSHAQNGVLSEALEQMAAKVEEGTDLSTAMEETGVFPEYAVSMVRAGQKTGRLESVMFHLSDYYKNEKNMKENIRSAIIYPISMIVMIIVILFIMLKMVLPVFRSVYDNLTGDLGSSSYSYIGFSYTLCRVLLIVMIVLVVAVLIGLLLWNNGKKEAVEKCLRKIPICASLFDTLAILRFTASYDMYLSSGEMQDEALLNSLPMADSKPVEEKLQRISKRMEEGHGFAQSAYEEELYEGVYGRMLIPGERSGNIESILQRLVDLLREDSAVSVTKIVNTLEPLLSGVLMISIAIVLLSLMLPLIGIMNSIG